MPANNEKRLIDLLIETIKQDQNAKHFSKELAADATKEEVREYCRLLFGEQEEYKDEDNAAQRNPYYLYYRNFDRNANQMLPDSQIDRVKKAILDRQAYFELSKISNIINELSVYPRPAFQRLIAQLSKEKQSELLENEAKKLKKLLFPKSYHDWLVAFRECGLDSIDERIISNCLREIDGQKLYAKVQNAEIAKVLAEYSIDLNFKSLDTLNDYLNYFVMNGDNRDMLVQYPILIGAITDIDGFLSEDKKPELKAQLTQVKVKACFQHKKNIALFDKLEDSDSEFEKECCRALACIEKPARVDRLSRLEIDKLIEIVKTSATYNDFKAAIVHFPLGGIEYKIPTWELVLTKERFNALKSSYYYELMTVRNEFQGEIQRQQSAMRERQEIMASFWADEEKMRPALERLASFSSISWLNFETETLAKRDATKAHSDYEKLGKFCNTACRTLSEQKEFYKTLATSLPSDKALKKLFFWERKQVKEHSQLVQKELLAIEKSLERYQILSQRIYGDPNYSLPDLNPDLLDQATKKGFLGVLQEAKELKRLDQDELPSDVKRCFIKDIEKEVQTILETASRVEDPGAVQASYNELVIPENKKAVKRLGRLDEGECFVHVQQAELLSVHNTATAAAFIETRKSIGPAKPGERTVQSIVMQIAKYPTASGPLNDHEKKILKQIQAKFITNLATDLLSTMEKLPTQDEPIALRGYGTQNKEPLALLWTVLMELAKANPKYQFNEEAIKVYSECFDPEQEKAKWWERGKYSSDSYYNQFFKNDETGGKHLKAAQQKIKDLYQKNFGSETKEQLRKDVNGLLSIGILSPGFQKIVRADPEPEREQSRFQL